MDGLCIPHDGVVLIIIDRAIKSFTSITPVLNKTGKISLNTSAKCLLVTAT